MTARWKDIAPGVGVLAGYRRTWLRADLLAGITVAAYLIPQVMAYAAIAGLPAVTGLYAFLGATIAYVFLGSSRQLSVGPESTTALMTAVTVAALGATAQNYAALCAALALVVGVLCLAGWLLRLGFLAELLSKPVLIGYMTGVAALMVLSQLKKLTGIPVVGETLVKQAISAWQQRGSVHVPTVLLAGGLLAMLLLGQRFFPKLPNPLFAVLIGAGVVSAFSLTDLGIKVIGEVPAGLPIPALPSIHWSTIAPMLLPALGIAVVGYSDNVLTARAFADKRGDRIDANQEFLSLGAANVLSGLFTGFPVSSSGSRTAIGASLGSKTQLYSIVAVVTVIGTVFFLRDLLAAFPTAALGALVVYAAMRLVELPEWRRLWAFRKSEFAIALATTLGVLLFDVLNGILVAIALSVADLLRRVARPHSAVLGYVPGLAGMHDVDDYAEVRQVPGLVVFRYDSPLFFANADHFQRLALEAVTEADSEPHWLLLNAEAIVQVDLTSLDALESLRAAVTERGIRFTMARVKQELHDELDRAGIVARMAPDSIFPTLPTAVTAYLMWHSAEHDALPEGMEIPPPPKDFLADTPD